MNTECRFLYCVQQYFQNLGAKSPQVENEAEIKHLRLDKKRSERATDNDTVIQSIGDVAKSTFPAVMGVAGNMKTIVSLSKVAKAR